MINLIIKDGLGNQMFQYMAGYALSRETGKKLLVNQNWFFNPWFFPPFLLVRRWRTVGQDLHSGFIDL